MDDSEAACEVLSTLSEISFVDFLMSPTLFLRVSVSFFEASIRVSVSAIWDSALMSTSSSPLESLSTPSDTALIGSDTFFEMSHAATANPARSITEKTATLR